ncbi:ABC transporter permease [Saccharibacillus sp. CPCC 101409]|uniref:ABC transporter permease n=1 Tax=Saccharibacillus sp. CPCC 101409 TaxID=3058041 RepID=UPI0026722A72|nr:ABC transporter permease [Saccharibacillus sp. CPCC 101409]MDO3413211.1 ABC transporter permease [Saccharibacillus sp. CPCC 101409]
MKSLWLQSKAESLRMARNPYFIFWSLTMPIVFYFIFTRLLNSDMPDASEWQMHYLMSMAAFSVMGTSVMTFGLRLVQERTQGWSVFIRVTPLRGAVYVAGKMIAQMLLNLLSVAVIFAAGYLINGVSLSAAEWISAGLWISLASLPFLALGSLLGCMRKVDTANGIGYILYMGLAVLGGLWIPLDMMPDAVRQIGRWLPAYNYGQGAWSIAGGTAPSPVSIAILLGYLVAFMILSGYVRKKQEAV